MHNMGEKFAILLRENCESTLLLDLTCIIYVHVKYTVAQIRYLNITLNIYTQYKKESFPISWPSVLIVLCLLLLIILLCCQVLLQGLCWGVVNDLELGCRGGGRGLVTS